MTIRVADRLITLVDPVLRPANSNVKGGVRAVFNGSVRQLWIYDMKNNSHSVQHSLVQTIGARGGCHEAGGEVVESDGR